MSSLSEIGFKLVRALLKYFEFLAQTPYIKYAALGFGAFIVFIKDHINPRSWKKSKNLKKR